MSLLPRSALLEKQIFTSKLIDMKINITKRFLLSLCLMTLTLLCGGNKAWGQTTSTLTFTTECGGSGTADDGVKWTVTSDAAESNYDKSKGIHYGTGKKAVSYLHLSTSQITGVVKKIVVNASGASGTSAKLDVTVNGNSFGNQKTITSTAKDYTFEGTGSGEIIVKLSQTSAKKALYVKSISVTYQASTPTPAPKFSLTGGTYNGPQHVTITAPEGYTGGIFYTTDGSSDPATSGIVYTSDGIDLTTTTTLRAVAYANERTFSSEATATYTIRSTDQKTNSVKFDFSKPADYGYDTPALTSGTDLEVGNTIVSNDVTITNTKTGTSTKTRFYNSNGTITFRPYKGAELSISVPAGYVITSIETQGTAGVFDLGGNSATKGVCTWEGLAQTVVLNHITTNAVLTSMTVNYRLLYFSDTEDLKASLPETELADQTVTLNRNLYSGWNTFCVPFALTQAQLEEAYGSGAVAKYLSGVTTDGAAATLHFTPEEKGGIKANKAYLLYLTADVTEAKTFSGVTLHPAGDCTTTVTAADGGDYTFQGILAPTTLATNDTQYFLNSDGTAFVLPRADSSPMKATRAYIIVPAPAAPAQGRQYSFDFNGTTTAIDNVNVSGMEDGAWYTISGIRINRPAAKGVYIHNGRKVIVK